MVAFEQYFKFGMVNRHTGKNHAVHLPGSALTEEERKYLIEAIAAYVKYNEGPKDLISIFMAAFISGVSYSGAYLGPGSDTK